MENPLFVTSLIPQQKKVAVKAVGGDSSDPAELKKAVASAYCDVLHVRRATVLHNSELNFYCYDHNWMTLLCSYKTLAHTCARATSSSVVTSKRYLSGG